MSEIKEAGERTSSALQVEQEHHWPEDMGRSLRQWASVCAALGVLGAAATGCETSTPQARIGSYVSHTTQIADNVWLIPSGESYGDSLVQFINDHPNLKVIDSDTGDSGLHGHVFSHVVLTEPVSK